jgi:hypothetical protein
MNKPEINTGPYQARAREQFARQTGVGEVPRLLSVGLVRKPLLLARIASMGGKMRRPRNERQYAIECAVRVFTHFNPDHGYCAKGNCLRCQGEIDNSANADAPIRIHRAVPELLGLMKERLATAGRKSEYSPAEMSHLAMARGMPLAAAFDCGEDRS